MNKPQTINDPKTGEPTGTLREAASQLVVNKIPPYSHDENVAGLRRGMELANSFGITSVASVARMASTATCFSAQSVVASRLTMRSAAAAGSASPASWCPTRD